MDPTTKRPLAQAVKFYAEEGCLAPFTVLLPIRCTYCDRQSHDGRAWFSADSTVVLCTDCATGGVK